MRDSNYGQIHFPADKDEKLTPAQVSKMQKSLEQARMLMKNIGVKNLGRKPASAGAKPKAEPKVETKPGEKRKRSKCGRHLSFANP